MTLKLLFTTALLGLHAGAAVAGTDSVSRGAYLARIMDCAGCHMPRDPSGAPIESAGLSGGTVGFEMPGLGIFWPPNLTSDQSGLGGWSKDEIKTALRTGVRPDGRILAPVMPWPSYAAISDEDLDALVDYLAAMPPVASERLDPVADAAQAKAPFFRVTLPNG